MSVTNHSSPALVQSVLQASQNGVLVYKGVRDDAGRLTGLQLMLSNAVAESNLNRPYADAIGTTCIRSGQKRIWSINTGR
ncbi:hypothetical protein [Spirosoma sp.]|uniref:hypothetical protein n=1 Tax=Spirosoma sp. TaxID=1899569 RepID=UPI002610E8E7|nr:hypothetical protein [Spirosoma sp.]MCX6218664.1 hypothetical protein [Spirosoma sp.]